MLYDPIKYVALLGQRELPRMLNIPQNYLNYPLLKLLGYLPQSMLHFICGVDYYAFLKKNSLQLGYNIIFVHPDIIRTDIEIFPWEDRTTPIILLMCTNDVATINRYNTIFEACCHENVLCIASDKCIPKIKIPCKVVPYGLSMWDWFYKFANTLNLDIDHKPFSVPILCKDYIDKGNVFSPSRINTQQLNAIQGNWDFGDEYSEVALNSLRMESTQLAYISPDGDNRQNILLEQIRKIRSMEDLCSMKYDVSFLTEEQFRAPLIISAPYTSVEMRKIDGKSKMTGVELRMARIVEKVLDADYSKNYIVKKELFDELSQSDTIAIKIEQGKIVGSRMTFFDNVAMLHSSISFSPYFRMPILGKNINAELSFVGIKNVEKVVRSNSRNKSVRKAMEKIGQKMASVALCQHAIKTINQDCAQIVALTDLPIEWMILDGVPLGFSHDVCRLPETPVQSLLSQYEEALFTPYIIPSDILNRTLVVYGNDEPAFTYMQEDVELLKEKLGFQTQRCLSKREFFDVVNDVTPDFLIIDTHGGVNEKTNQSYIMMGDDMVTGDDVINSRIHPRLVFLSACNTFTTYNSVDTIANAFFESGACTVTTSYMPLEVTHATLLYCRLLNNLSIACKKNIHRNWLSFMSHLLRTSYIHAPMLNHNKAGEWNQDLSNIISSLSTDSMLFHNRKKVYSELRNNFSSKDKGINYDYIIPHYLMYSTLGRADLIRFESFIESIQKKRDIN